MHRVGRTGWGTNASQTPDQNSIPAGRIGNKGVATSFVTRVEPALQEIEKTHILEAEKVHSGTSLEVQVGQTAYS